MYISQRSPFTLNDFRIDERPVDRILRFEKTDVLHWVTLLWSGQPYSLRVLPDHNSQKLFQMGHQFVALMKNKTVINPGQPSNKDQILAGGFRLGEASWYYWYVKWGRWVAQLSMLDGNFRYDVYSPRSRTRHLTSPCFPPCDEYRQQSPRLCVVKNGTIKY